MHAMPLPPIHATAEGIRRVPPAEETARRLAEEQEGEWGSKEWCVEAGFNPEKLKVRKQASEQWRVLGINMGSSIIPSWRIDQLTWPVT